MLPCLAFSGKFSGKYFAKLPVHQGACQETNSVHNQFRFRSSTRGNLARMQSDACGLVQDKPLTNPAEPKPENHLFIFLFLNFFGSVHFLSKVVIHSATTTTFGCNTNGPDSSLLSFCHEHQI